MAEEFEKLHPILNEITRTFTQLYERQKDVDTLEKLIKLEAILKVKLDEIQAVRAKVENE